MSSKFVQTEIATIKNSVSSFNGILNIEDPDARRTAFGAARIEMNLHILQALTGGEIATNKKGEKVVKFKHSLPTKAQIAEISEIVDDFYNNVEVPFYKSAMPATQTDDQGMEIPVEYTPVYGKLPTIDGKVKNKNLADYILNNDINAISNYSIRSVDCARIAAYGEAARKNANLKMTLIIGGITVAVVGGVVVGVVVYNKKKKAKEDDCIDVDYEDIEEVDLDDEVPEVEIEAELVSANLDNLGF